MKETFSFCCRYEKGEEDYDEAVARISEEEEKAEAQNFEDKLKPIISVVGMLLESFIGRSMSKRSTTPASQEIIGEYNQTDKRPNGAKTFNYEWNLEREYFCNSNFVSMHFCPEKFKYPSSCQCLALAENCCLFV
jgi:hypothetical protein